MDKTGRNGLRIGDISSQNFKTRFERLREKHFQLLDEIDSDYNNLEVEFLSSIEFLKRFQHIDSEHYLNQGPQRRKKSAC